MQTELAWLLAQEARSAARKLRQGVGIPSEDEPTHSAASVEDSTGGVEKTLDRLDEAVSALASLHGNALPRGRRGKVDLAALIWEIAPEARVQIEMGEGTSVFGDESEIRRILQVLIGQSGLPAGAGGTQNIAIKREGDEISVAVGLGSDQPTTFETERAWLSRMAVRYGGRLKLDGSTQTLVLPADIDMQRRELESLKKELAAAQAQGQAYARELATMFARGDAHSPMSARTSPSQQPASGDALAVLVAAARTTAAELRGILSAIGRDISRIKEMPGEPGEIASSVGRHVTGASEVVADLARLGSCPVGELPRHADVALLLRDAARAHLGRAERHDVDIDMETPPTAGAVVPAGGLSVLLQVLLDHAISASPSGSRVRASLADDGTTLTVLVDDSGVALPMHAKSAVLSRDFEAVAHGRPSGLALISAHAIAAHVGVPLDIEEAPNGGARVRLTIPKTP